MSGGYPAWAHDGVPVDPAVFGVAADTVAAVQLRDGAASTALPLVNNAFYADVPLPADGQPWSVALVVTYRDGSLSTVQIPDPRP